MPKIPFGEYDPTDCSEQKIAHGFNCTITCPFGFEVKGGPSVKSCGGKRTGVWSNKNKSPKCIGAYREEVNALCPVELRRTKIYKIIAPFNISVTDVSPPTVDCPDNFTVVMESDRSYSIVKEFPQPNVSGKLRNQILFSNTSPEFCIYSQTILT